MPIRDNDPTFNGNIVGDNFDSHRLRISDEVQQKLHGELPGRGGQYYYDPTDAYANLHKAVISVEPTIYPAAKVYFKAFITAFTQNLNSAWESESVFGRTDPIYMFKQTTRTISLAFKVVATTSGEAYENLGRVQELANCLYPAYTEIGSATTIAQSPLCRLKVLNLTPSATGRQTAANLYNMPDTYGRGSLVAVKSISIAHNIENAEGGVFQLEEGAFVPKFVDITMDCDVIHENTLGWFREEWGMRAANHGRTLYGVNPGTSTYNDRRNTDSSRGGGGIGSAHDRRARVLEHQGPRRRHSSGFQVGYRSTNFVGNNRLEPTDPSLYSDNTTAAARAASAEAENDALRANAEARYGGLFGGLIARRDANRLDSGRTQRLGERQARLHTAATEAGTDTRRGQRLLNRRENVMQAAQDEMERLEYIQGMQDFID